MELTREAQPSSVVELENWVDIAVMQFIVDMKYKLRLNNHKGHWKDYDLQFLIKRLEREVIELKDAAHDWSKNPCADSRQLLALVHECADVANFALMIADNAKRTMRAIDANETDQRKR